MQSLVLPVIRAKLELDRNQKSLRGEAYLVARQASAAADQFRAILAQRGVVLMGPTASLARLGRVWKDADLDIPILQQTAAGWSGMFQTKSWLEFAR